ncbi:MAG: sugar transferase [Rhodobacter sp.]|nr:sugar transferase [Paracoccaceae bacterium]MCC0077776.1 sugar transferase [Rhodobacter sp.]
MTLHYRELPDVTGVDLGPLPAAGGFPYWPTVPVVARPLPADVRPVRHAGYLRRGKRVLDIVLSLAALILAAPVLVLLAAALWIESGNPFYTQERLGQNGRRFRMFKLRTMVIDAETHLAACLDRDPAMRAEWELTQKLKRDPRITPIGRLLRKTSMDELPQLFNVLKGDMSMVGPRPMLPEQLPLYAHPDAYLTMRPGVTGLWQVTARNEQSFALRATLDLRYAQRVSLGMDLRLILATLAVVFRATGY